MCCLMLDMGLGKTVITLSALWELALDRFDIGKILVIAPKRVATDTWPKELKKWEHLIGLLLLPWWWGSQKQREDALARPSFLYIINRKMSAGWCRTIVGILIRWLLMNYPSFKSNKAERFKALKKVRPLVNRVIGLTGTPAPNSLLDLWPQMYLLDMGQRSGTVYHRVTGSGSSNRTNGTGRLSIATNPVRERRKQSTP